MIPLLLGLLAIAAASSGKGAARSSSAPSSGPAPPPSAAKLAALALWRFLTQTGRFGGGADRPIEIKRAQLALGVKADGIVGPITRAAATAVGVTLPMPSSTRPTPATPPDKLTIEHPADTKATPEEQAAIDAAVSEAIRAGMPKPIDANPEYAAPPSSSSSTPDPPPFPAELAPPSSSAAKDAAGSLLAFLIKTRRFGSTKDRPAEVLAAQRALGVKPDGIVGPSTRAAAAKLGVALPPRR